MSKLSKEVCKKCRANEDSKYKRLWDDVDERLWDEHEHVLCYHNTSSWEMKHYNINNEPPEGCKMKLEQTVLQKGQK